MAGKFDVKNNDAEEAKNVFDALLALKRGRRDEAIVHFEYSKIESGNEHRMRALELFRELHEVTPVYAYQLRINELEQRGVA